jgi:hypothetical protein
VAGGSEGIPESGGGVQVEWLDREGLAGHAFPGLPGNI